MTISRRRFLRASVCGSLSTMVEGRALAWSPSAPARPSERGAPDAIDHIVWAISDLDQGIDLFQRRSGVRAVEGGRHPGLGTHNALVALGPRQYLEIIAPVPGAQVVDMLAYLRQLDTPRLIMWAVRAEDMSARVHQLSSAGYQTGDIQDGSRLRPDGKLLAWKSVRVTGPGDESFPFFIEWSRQSIHPASDSPGGCSLRAFELQHPNPPVMQRILRAIHLDIPTQRSADRRFRAVLDTPNGEVVLE